VHKTVLVCGDRNWTDKEAIKLCLTALRNQGYDTIIEGECRGADFLARIVAEELGYTVLNRDSTTKGFPAQWNKFGRAAGPIRNQEMLDVGKPTLVVYFHPNLSQSRGTKDMVTRASVTTVNGSDLKSIIGL